jgi:hypothetical protein
MEKIEGERRRQRRMEKERARWMDALALYEVRWKMLLSGIDATKDPPQELNFADIPWPVFVSEVGPSHASEKKSPAAPEIEDLTIEAISAFLLYGGESDEGSSTKMQAVKKERRDKLREAMLRYHPDKFEGRIMPRIRASDKELVRDAVGRVARAINDLLAEQ